jgi:hypothetical protein
LELPKIDAVSRDQAVNSKTISHKKYSIQVIEMENIDYTPFVKKSPVVGTIVRVPYESTLKLSSQESLKPLSTLGTGIGSVTQLLNEQFSMQSLNP